MNSLSLVLAAASLAMLSILDGIPSSANSKFVASHRCSYGYAYADGCSAAPSDGNYVNPHFFLYAKQSGQKAYFRAPFVQSNHPPAWNVAGVDYPVGYRRSIKLKDPTSGQLPKGCRLSKGNVAAAVICDNVKDVV